MPLPNAHIALARLALQRWALTPATAPFDVCVRSSRNAFLQGAIAPDMGWFPGGEARVSVLAHGERAGDLIRCLLDSARTPGERAFAWGWFTHVIVDTELHPIVNACARRLAWRETARAAGLTSATTHISVELGLDIVVYDGDPDVRAVRLRPCLTPSMLDWLSNAYHDVCGLRCSHEMLLRSHRAVAPLTTALGWLARVHRSAARGSAAALLTRRLLIHVAEPQLTTEARGFLYPVQPPRRLLAAFAALAARFCQLLRRYQRVQFADLGNPDVNGVEPHLQTNSA